MDREAEEGVLGVEEEIYKRTGVASTEIRQKNEDGSRCIRLYDRRSIIYEM